MICDKIASTVLNLADDEDFTSGLLCTLSLLIIFIGGGCYVILPYLIQIPLIIIAVSILIVTEIIFLFDKAQPNAEDNKICFTFKRKLICYIDVVFILSIIGVFVWAYNFFIPITEWVSVFAIYTIYAIIVVIALYGYIWLNSKKYRKKD